MATATDIAPTVVLPQAGGMSARDINRIFRAFGQRPVRVWRVLRCQVGPVAHRSRPSAVRANRRATARRTRRSQRSSGRSSSEPHQRPEANFVAAHAVATE